VLVVWCKPFIDDNDKKNRKIMKDRNKYTKVFFKKKFSTLPTKSKKIMLYIKLLKMLEII
jgi:hypothetical protein